MRHGRTLVAVLVALLVALSLAATASAQQRTFTAQMTGAEEVPANASPATGQATYTLSADGKTLHFKLTVSNITNPFMAHIHLGAKGTNGPIVLPLYSAAPGGGLKNGTLVEGDATAAQLTGSLAGKSMADLVAAMEAGNTYSNVHTNDGKDPAGTGPGDLSAGEIRGQNVVAAAPGLPYTGGGGGRIPAAPAAGALAAILLGVAGGLGLERRRARGVR